MMKNLPHAKGLDRPEGQLQSLYRSSDLLLGSHLKDVDWLHEASAEQACCLSTGPVL